MHIEMKRIPHRPDNAERRVPASILVASIILLLLLCNGCTKNTERAEQSGGPTGVEYVNSHTTLPEGNQIKADRDRILAEGVRNVRMVLESKDGNDEIGVVVLDKVAGPEAVHYEYDWTNNGRPAGRERSVTGFKRGDKMGVKITPVDGERRGRAKVLTTEIRNSAPKVLEVKNIKTDDTHLTYQVIAADPDGDAMTYSLADPPKGMTINPKSGLVEWTVDGRTQGKFTVTVKVSDGQGGETAYPVSIQTQMAAQ